MGIYYESLETFMKKGGLKQTTITAKQLLPAVVAHMVRMDRKFTLYVNGRMPKPMNEMLDEVFELCHLQQPFYTQHCASRKSRYMSVSSNRIKIEFTFTYRMPRSDEKWVITQMESVLTTITNDKMTDLDKVIAVHDYIVRNFQYEMNTTGSPFTVLTFLKEGKGVCMAYALLFEKMMELLQIKAFYVVGHAVGESELGHAWNMVELDGEWYHIDATWNDLGSKSSKYEIRYRYFLKTDDFMKQDHTWEYAHYPACTSKRFDCLTSIYDAGVIDGRMYYPNKEGNFTVLDVHTLTAKQLKPNMKVQHCTVVNKKILFSNYSDQGFLYRFDIQTGEYELMERKTVGRIQQTIHKTTVTFSGDNRPLEIKRQESTHNVQEDVVQSAKSIDVTIPFMHFDQIWMGTYEGTLQNVAFEEAQLQLFIYERYAQLTVSISKENNELQIFITSNRRAIKFNKPCLLMIHESITGEIHSIENEHGEQILYEKVNGVYKFFINKNGRIRIK